MFTGSFDFNTVPSDLIPTLNRLHQETSKGWHEPAAAYGRRKRMIEERVGQGQRGQLNRATQLFEQYTKFIFDKYTQLGQKVADLALLKSLEGGDSLLDERVKAIRSCIVEVASPAFKLGCCSFPEGAESEEKERLEKSERAFMSGVTDSLNRATEKVASIPSLYDFCFANNPSWSFSAISRVN